MFVWPIFPYPDSLPPEWLVGRLNFFLLWVLYQVSERGQKALCFKRVVLGDY